MILNDFESAASTNSAIRARYKISPLKYRLAAQGQSMDAARETG